MTIEIRRVESGYELTVDGKKIDVFATVYDAAKYVETVMTGECNKSVIK